jgi:aryl-alcohol dehydrogenase-like predicted oxidoreductase
MDYGSIPGIDKPISRLVQGTVMLNTAHLEAGFSLLDDVLALGCTAFDTAHDYGRGDSERCLGRWVRERGIQDRVVIIDKGAHHNEDRRRVTPFDITADLYDSLARLHFEPIDLYLLHRDDPSVPVGPIIETLNQHLVAGRIRAFGASNWSHQRIEEANAYAALHGLAPFAASSPHFSLAEQLVEPWEGCVAISGNKQVQARSWYRQTQLPLFAWSSLAGGFFSGRFTRENLDSFVAYLDKICVTSYCHEANFQRLERAQQLASEKGVSLPQIALAYVMNQPLNLFAVVGCVNGAEFAANELALVIKLDEAELEWLDLRRDEP